MDVPTDIPPLGGAILGTGAIGVWLWNIFRKAKVDIGTDKLFLEGAKDRAELRARVQELEKENKELNQRLFDVAGRVGGSSESVRQLEARLAAVEKSLVESKRECDDSEMTIDILTGHLVKMSFYLSSLKGELLTPIDPTGLVTDLPQILNDITNRRTAKRHAYPVLT